MYYIVVLLRCDYVTIRCCCFRPIWKIIFYIAICELLHIYIYIYIHTDIYIYRYVYIYIYIYTYTICVCVCISSDSGLSFLTEA